MRLTLYTDYSLRVLVYLAALPERPSTIKDVADAYGISRNHVHKIVNDLVHHGYIQTTRGRNGGIVLAKNPGSIVLGTLIRLTEPDFRVVECLDGPHSDCPIDSVCVMRHLLNTATEAFLKTLDRYTLEDIVENVSLLRPILIGNLRPAGQSESDSHTPADRKVSPAIQEPTQREQP